MFTDFELSEYLVARIFHDISGPVGAINNGTSFLTEDRSEIRNRALDLIKTSASEAVAKIQYYRKTFGNTQPGNADYEQLKNIINNIFAGTKITIKWQTPENDIVIPNFAAKLLCNMIYIVSSVMIYGGNITLNIKPEDEKYHIEVKGEGMAIKYSHDITEIVLNHSSAISLSTHNVHLFYIKRLLEEYDANYKIEHTDNFCSFSSIVG